MDSSVHLFVKYPKCRYLVIRHKVNNCLKNPFNLDDVYLMLFIINELKNFDWFYHKANDDRFSNKHGMQ
ncbi:MAG: hypothetical protein MJK04_31765 [Psychrosphaera sp.]|nr:hypothetical protein [Psychrosphaera sp.]